MAHTSQVYVVAYMNIFIAHLAKKNVVVSSSTPSAKKVCPFVLVSVN